MIRIANILILFFMVAINLYAGDELSKIRDDIKREGLNWMAGETRILRMDPINRRLLLSPNPPEIKNINIFSSDKNMHYAYPSNMDYRNYLGYNWMTPVRDQGSCGSCWAFSTLGSLEAMIKLYNSDPYMNLDLSEQDLVSCTATGSCAYGGFQLFAANYIKASGVVDEACFPYIAQEGDCKNKCSNPTLKEYIKDAGMVGFFSIATEEDIKAALIKYGPIPSSMKVYSDFYAYKGGVYQKTANATEEGWHAIVIIGWDDAKNAWICKNSWGDDFGDKGYFMIKKGDSFIGWGTEWMIYKDDLKPRFCTDTPSVNLTVNLRDKSTQDFEVKIYNCGSWVFEWTAFTTDTYIQILQKTGVAIRKPSSVTAHLDASILEVGTYTTYINFKSDGVENSPLMIPVRITVVDNEPIDYGNDIYGDIIDVSMADIVEITDLKDAYQEDTHSSIDIAADLVLEDISIKEDSENIPDKVEYYDTEYSDVISLKDSFTSQDTVSIDIGVEREESNESDSGCGCIIIE